MKVINIHSREINVDKTTLQKLLSTLATPTDQIWPKEKWPKMYLDNGLNIGSKGGHGPIRYQISYIDHDGAIQFEFSKPKGFIGHHRFHLKESDQKTTLTHTIDIHTTAWGYLQWIVAIKWLHNALIEDALDKVESKYLAKQLQTPWSLWVKLLRTIISA